MPQRSNLFQDVVAIVRRHMDPGAEIEESAMLRSRATGRLREVDIAIRGTVGGQPVTVGLEATKGERKATVEWVERMYGKHSALGTNSVILVSGSGFTTQAKEAAEYFGLIPLEPTGDPRELVLGGLETVWGHGIRTKAEEARLDLVDPTSGDRNHVDHADKGAYIFTADGARRGVLWDFVTAVLNGAIEDIAERAEVARGGQNGRDVEGSFTLNVGNPVIRDHDGDHRIAVEVSEDGRPPSLMLVERLEVDCTFKAFVRQIPLTRMQLGDAAASLDLSLGCGVRSGPGSSVAFGSDSGVWV